jgi:hypothetical protein
MGHASQDDLIDLSTELAVVRSWPQVNEPTPNTFYIKRTPFMHFHTKDGKRWADVRSGADWGPEIEVPWPASAAARAKFLKAIERRYRATLGSMATKREARP